MSVQNAGAVVGAAGRCRRGRAARGRGRTRARTRRRRRSRARSCSRPPRGGAGQVVAAQLAARRAVDRVEVRVPAVAPDRVRRSPRPPRPRPRARCRSGRRSRRAPRSCRRRRSRSGRSGRPPRGRCRRSCPTAASAFRCRVHDAVDDGPLASSPPAPCLRVGAVLRPVASTWTQFDTWPVQVKRPDDSSR